MCECVCVAGSLGALPVWIVGIEDIHTKGQSVRVREQSCLKRPLSLIKTSRLLLSTSLPRSLTGISERFMMCPCRLTVTAKHLKSYRERFVIFILIYYWIITWGMMSVMCWRLSAALQLYFNTRKNINIQNQKLVEDITQPKYVSDAILPLYTQPYDSDPALHFSMIYFYYYYHFILLLTFKVHPYIHCLVAHFALSFLPFSSCSPVTLPSVQHNTDQTFDLLIYDWTLRASSPVYESVK